MDELTIDDKKYISSKRAANITGYAKDYIGQLCREGYVEARRIGRNWYVLESAIKDHRFGREDHATEPSKVGFTLSPVSDPPNLTVASRYEAVIKPELPSINRLQQIKEQTELPEIRKAPLSTTDDQTEDFHAAWQAWFDSFGVANPEEKPQIEIQNNLTSPDTMGKELPVAVPIHHLFENAEYQAPPRKLLPEAIVPTNAAVVQATRSSTVPTPRKNTSALRPVISVCLFLVILLSLAVTAIGTGYVDTYIGSSSLANIFSGTSILYK